MVPVHRSPRIYTAWCDARGVRALPARSETIAAFVDAMATVRAPATVRRYATLATVSKEVGTLHETRSPGRSLQALRGAPTFAHRLVRAESPQIPPENLRPLTHLASSTLTTNTRPVPSSSQTPPAAKQKSALRKREGGESLLVIMCVPWAYSGPFCTDRCLFNSAGSSRPDRASREIPNLLPQDAHPVVFDLVSREEEIQNRSTWS